MEVQYAVFGIGTQETMILGIILGLIVLLGYFIYKFVYYKAHYDISNKNPNPSFCASCGTPVIQGAAFCSKCGKPIS